MDFKHRPNNNPSPRPASSYTVCFACDEKGHYAKECNANDKVSCNFCERTGHVEAVRRQKKTKETGREASFFHGFSFVAELQPNHTSSPSIDLSTSDYFFGKTMFGELEQIASAASTYSPFSFISQEENIQGEILAIHVMDTRPTNFLGDRRATHHIVHKLGYYSEIFPQPGIFQIKQVHT